ncbi:hypothetical protein HWQ46_03590 [Shewanella sp. D64]|uniref:hypothetical protein n=1 Tax=unclassified Shewanella TaxID=196818 RepID=UPI0022BA5C51|nr:MULTISPECIES: hypothetical protein [unclassified Shewanella]MEC4724629.1 hypothetical protein [Shewanella sp. D64]MEC4736594.1 hypothetical protein [Shewanella sp. E94]WBJ94732.1 hypothetical protein HWQ47_23230 [Shewanella sp. MTB7]
MLDIYDSAIRDLPPDTLDDTLEELLETCITLQAKSKNLIVCHYKLKYFIEEYHPKVLEEAWLSCITNKHSWHAAFDNNSWEKDLKAHTKALREEAAKALSDKLIAYEKRFNLLLKFDR